ncbi:MAG: hypothetical protein FJ027_10775 [Candidatus Rokubacteria bacterium]|nr:hypothetical protein [Candidatus Rokubacteria bacterium]
MAPAARLVDALRTRSLCCDCLVRTTGLSPVELRSEILRAARVFRLDTWTPCEACGAVDETYRMMAARAGSGVARARA